jgi:RNA polymerase sigma-70 factor, ECF subfamily
MARARGSDPDFTPRSTSTSTNGSARTETRIRAAVALHLRVVQRVLRRAGLSAHDAEDASQEAFLLLAQRTDAVPAQAERSFLVSAARRVAADRKRSRWYRSVNVGMELDDRADTALGADARLDLRRSADLLQRALAELDANQRAVYVLGELEQLSRSEVARALSLPMGTVATRLRRARAACAAAVRRLERAARR